MYGFQSRADSHTLEHLARVLPFAVLKFSPYMCRLTTRNRTNGHNKKPLKSENDKTVNHVTNRAQRSSD